MTVSTIEARPTATSGPSDWPFVHALIILLIFILFTVDYLVEFFPQLPWVITWSPELVAAAVTPFIVARLAFMGLTIAPKYLLWGFAMISVMIISAIIHEVNPGALFMVSESTSDTFQSSLCH